jgi:hypothetical protein
MINSEMGIVWLLISHGAHRFRRRAGSDDMLDNA